MRNKGIVRTFAILMAIVCVYQLLFTWKTRSVERAAAEYATTDGYIDYAKEAKYLDSISNEVVYNFLWLRGYTYKECKERELNLGLDLKGGMNVILEVSVADVIRALSNYNADPVFQQALTRATQLQGDGQNDYITALGRAFDEIDPNIRIASFFDTQELGSKMGVGASNERVLEVLRAESDGAIDNAFNIIRTRIDRFGVVQPTIQQLQTRGQILVELPGVKEPERVMKLLQGSANLEFWETYENNQQTYEFLMMANAKIKETEDAKKASAADSTTVIPAMPAETAAAPQDTSENTDLIEQMTQATATTADSAALSLDTNPLFTLLLPVVDPSTNQLMAGSVIGQAAVKDTVRINEYLARPEVRELFPEDMRLLWEVKPTQFKDEAGRVTAEFMQLHAIRTGRDGRPPLGGDVITDASANFNDMGGSSAEVSMSMNSEGSQTWARLTRDNIGRCIAIVLDNNVYSSPRVQTEISGGRSSITGNFTINEATDLANILKSGKLPARTTVVSNEVVGPTLGKESIRAGFMSFIMGLIVVMIYLAFYYNRAGMVADVALLVNMFFLIGVLASLGAVLTLPGIAGIVLTFGMANDANIIIYERIREELRAGKGIRLAVSDGYKNAYSAIIDGNVTTFLTACVLFFFGTGPIQGFATTLALGILTSLFCAIFISRLIFERLLSKNRDIKFSNPLTEGVFRNAKFNFIRVRKRFYIISLVVIVIGLSSMVLQGFNRGIDFTGGRSYTVRFDETKNVNTVELQSSLRDLLGGDMPEVKTFGPDNQVKITTQYLLDEEQNADFKQDVDSIIEVRLYEGAMRLNLLSPETTVDEFRNNDDNDVTYIKGRQQVGASIADDIKRNAVIAVVLSLMVMFLYIFLRFRNWQFGLSAVASLTHDSLIMISLYSLLWKIAPFSMEIDQQFIAAILTIIGYSINDTVIVFDRIREWVGLYPKRPTAELYNSAINSTLGRTMNTSATTMFVLLIICIFGSEILRGFAFSMLIGVAVGTYSSICTAAPIVYDLISRKKRRQEMKSIKEKK